MHGEGRGVRGKGGQQRGVLRGGMHGEGRGVRGKGGHVWQKGGHVWQRGACVVKGGVRGMHAPYEIRPVNARAVRILLECILVSLFSSGRLNLTLRILTGMLV